MKVAFLTSYNSDLIKTGFEEFVKRKNIDVKFWWNDYSLHEESVYNNQSKLYQFEPELILIHFEVESLLGELMLDPLSINSDAREKLLGEVKEKLKSLTGTLCKNFPGSKIIVQNFVLRSPVYLGLFDSNMQCGAGEIVLSLNMFLLSLKNKYSGKLIIQDYNSLIAQKGIQHCIDSRMLHLTKYPFSKSFSEELFQHYYKVISILVLPKKKCIVLDLDNTLWGGIIGQDGIENIELGSGGLGESYVNFQKALVNFHRRGIILTVCSKNNYDDAIEMIEKHPSMILRMNYFASLQINWQDKATSVRVIADELNLGTDSFVFLDNDPAECELVRQQLPEVTVVNLTGDPDNFIKQLLSIESLDTIEVTKEDQKRNEIYQQNAERLELQNNCISLDDYYRSLEMKAYVLVNEESYATRISQLTQKTNQFNLTSKKYSTGQIYSFMQDGEHRIYSLKLTDKFGDNGITLAAIVKCSTNEWTIDSFLMSCRIIGRKAETALLNVIIDDALVKNVNTLQGEFLPTKKNIAFADFYLLHNFEKISDTKWKLNLPAAQKNHCIEIIMDK